MRDRHKKKLPFQDVAEQVAPIVPKEVEHYHFDGGHASIQQTVLEIRPDQIAVGLPMDELMFSKFFVNYVGLSVMPWDVVITTESTYLPDARNQIHNKFLDIGLGSHLLMLDSDVLPPPRFINTLIDHKLPMVGGWYRKKERYGYKDTSGEVHVTQRPVVYDWKDGFVQRIEPGVGLEKVAGAGAGAWLMHRSVAEALGRSPYDMIGGGEDLLLCQKLTALGVDLWIDWNLPCAHVGTFYV